MRRPVWLLVTATVLLGCVPPPQQIPPSRAPTTVERIPFPVPEYALLPNNSVVGSSELRGQAFLKTRGGGVKTAAGEQVFLQPVTSYSDQWYQVSYIGQQPLGPHDARLEQYLRTTVADADGRFAFRRVPAGTYYVTTKVQWAVPVHGLRLPNGETFMMSEGDWVSSRVSLQDSETSDVVLTR